MQAEVEIDDIENQLDARDIADEKSDQKERKDRLRCASHIAGTQTTRDNIAQDNSQHDLAHNLYLKLKRYRELSLVWSFPLADTEQ